MEVQEIVSILATGGSVDVRELDRVEKVQEIRKLLTIIRYNCDEANKNLKSFYLAYSHGAKLEGKLSSDLTKYVKE